MKQILAGLLLLFFVINAPAQKQAKERITWKTYANAKEKVSISYPASWEKKEVENTVFFFMAPYTHQGQKFRENVNLVTGPAEDLYLVEYLMDARKKLAENVEGFRELKSQYIKIDSLDCCRMIYQFKYKNLVLKDAYYLVLKDGKAYSLTCSALEGTFDQYYPIFEKIARSFKIK
jgi:hypothetical protein